MSCPWRKVENIVVAIIRPAELDKLALDVKIINVQSVCQRVHHGVHQITIVRIPFLLLQLRIFEHLLQISCILITHQFVGWIRIKEGIKPVVPLVYVVNKFSQVMHVGDD